MALDIAQHLQAGLNVCLSHNNQVIIETEMTSQCLLDICSD